MNKNTRQQVLVLYLSDSDMSSEVVGWSFYDGTARGDARFEDFEKPPYRTGLEALCDGWRLLQYPQLQRPFSGTEQQSDYLKFEFVFEKLVQI